MAQRMSGTEPVTDHPIVLFDGVCNLCNASVNFIIDRDPRAAFHFAPLQSDRGRELLQQKGLPTETLDTIVLIEGDRTYSRSAAALRIARRLSWPWPVFFVLIAVPAVIRDLIYSCVARNRYRWFGKSDTCRVPTAETEQRFLA